MDYFHHLFHHQSQTAWTFCGDGGALNVGVCVLGSSHDAGVSGHSYHILPSYLECVQHHVDLCHYAGNCHLDCIVPDLGHHLCYMDHFDQTMERESNRMGVDKMLAGSEQATTLADSSQVGLKSCEEVALVVRCNNEVVEVFCVLYSQHRCQRRLSRP